MGGAPAPVLLVLLSQMEWMARNEQLEMNRDYKGV
jgi:hypothetical protein